MKTWLISFVVKFLTGALMLGVGVWYLSSSIGGASLSYISIDNFMQQIGVSETNIASAKGCFLCTYIDELFGVLGRATTMFWEGIVHNLWILMAIGFGIFIILHTVKFFHEHVSSKDVKDLSNKDPKLDFKKWFEKVWKTGIRVLIAGVLVGALNWSNTNALKIVSDVTITPVLYVGSVLSMATTKVVSHTQCNIEDNEQQSDSDVLTPILKPFMCTMGNLNTIMLAGAGGGFALMNYAWLGFGGGFFTSIAGLALILAFLIIGFDLIFQVLSVMLKVIFIIIFLPILIASYAFEETWALAKGLIDNSINKILIPSAITIIKISLKTCIIYAIVYFSADSFYPGPVDGFTTIMPPLLNGEIITNNQDTQEMSVMAVFSKCEEIALIDGKMDKNAFKNCFKNESTIVKQKHPNAFDFMDNGFDFFIFMIGVALLYFWIVSPKIDGMLGGKSKEEFDYGGWLKDFGKTIYNTPEKIYKGIKDKLK